MRVNATLTGVVVLAASLALEPPSVSAQALTTTRGASSDFLATSQGANYWTAERLRAAQPIPWYDEATDTTAVFASPLDATPLAPAESVPGGTSAGHGNAPPGALESNGAEATEETDSQSTAGAEFGEDFGTADIGDNDFVNKTTTLWKQYPWKAMGKLLFNTSSYCSASVVSPNNVIVTAAHCCYDRGAGRWNSNFAFVPAMRSTTRPYGTFPYTSATVLTAWITDGGRQNDVCVLKLGKNAAGANVSPKTGWLGRSWNFPSVQHHFAFGYPSNISSGSYKYECSAESYASCGSGLVNAMGCNMTFGSSGGPWLRVFKRFGSGAMNFVNGVVSGHDACTGTFGQSFNGPRFTTDNIVPLCNVAGC